MLRGMSCPSEIIRHPIILEVAYRTAICLRAPKKHPNLLFVRYTASSSQRMWCQMSLEIFHEVHPITRHEADVTFQTMFIITPEDCIV